MAVFNPKILDASIRDVALCLTDNQKADLLLYAMRSLHFEGRSRTVIENAIQSCLQISTLSPENTAKARIMRARARLTAGSHFGAQEDLQAALAAEPDNPEAKALLHQRSVTVEKLLSPIPRNNDRFSIEIWREVLSFLPRHDLKTLLFVPHVVSRVASQLLFRELVLHFSGSFESDEEVDTWDGSAASKDQDVRHAQRSADILTRIIVDTSFAGAVRTLRIYAPKRDKDGSMAFQTGMLTNALPKLINLRNVHISAGCDGIVPVLRILQASGSRLRGLSLHSPDGPGELGFLELKHLAHFSYATIGGNASQVHNFIAQNRTTLRTISLDNQHWTFPTDSLSIRNLTHINFSGHLTANSQVIADILTNGRQLESLTLGCSLDCTVSSQFRTLPSSLPFLRHFAFSVNGISRRTQDRDLFPAIAEFLRDRKQLRTLHLTAPEESVQRAVGFDASVWGVLPSLVNLKGLSITYPKDLAPGLASWLVPRSVLALTLDCVSLSTRDPVPFLNQLRAGVPQTLRYIGLTDFPLRAVSTIVAQGFPMVRLVRVGGAYWTVNKNADGAATELEQWPARRVAYHTPEWLEWLGCEDAQVRSPAEFPA